MAWVRVMRAEMEKGKDLYGSPKTGWWVDLKVKRREGSNVNLRFLAGS